MKPKMINMMGSLIIALVLCTNSAVTKTVFGANGKVYNFQNVAPSNEYVADYSEIVTMYALDGRTIDVEKEQVAAYEQVGWYWGEPVTVQSIDGRTLTIGKNRVADYEKVGWYWGAPQTMYTYVDRDRKLVLESAIVGLNRVLEYEANDWYWGEPTTIYDAEGYKAAYTGINRVLEYESMGFYWGQPTTMYALDGRTIIVGENRVPEYENVGWYWGEPVVMQSLDGRTITVGEYRIKAYENVGWYWGKPTILYNWKGEPVTVGENRVNEYLSDGYTKEKVTDSTPQNKKGSDPCYSCNAGWDFCSYCGGSGSIRTYSSWYGGYVNERCPASGCFNGRTKCILCGGDGWK